MPVAGHQPVMLREVLEMLAPRAGQTFVDCTIGRAGHAQEIAARIAPKGLLVGMDVDPRNLEFARQRLANAPSQVRLFHANFAELRHVLAQVQRDQVDAILADLGLSTNQFLDPSYGLSFSVPAPLDMRLDPRLETNAADFVNSLSEKDLANLLYALAQERFSRRVARKIAEARRIAPIKTTERLAELVRSAIPRGGALGRKIDPATRTFLALRMKVNREMENLSALLEQAPGMLKRGGRLAIIAFQSMEDRLVKQAFRSAERTGQLKLLTKKPLTPTESEIVANPRSRSAKLRVAEKT